MLSFYSSAVVRTQGDDMEIGEASPQPAGTQDLQVRRLGQRFAFTPETARTYANLAFSAGRRS
jgi:hypothetical protein